MTKGKVNLQISFCHAGGRAVEEGSANFVNIAVMDAESGVQMVTLTLRPADFAMALGSRYQSDISAEFGDLSLVGCKRETKMEAVVVKESYGKLQEEWDAYARKCVAPHEVDGWMARLSDVSNHRYALDGSHQRVNFHRFIDPDTGEPVLPKALR